MPYAPTHNLAPGYGVNKANDCKLSLGPFAGCAGSREPLLMYMPPLGCAYAANPLQGRAYSASNCKQARPAENTTPLTPPTASSLANTHVSAVHGSCRQTILAVK